MLMCTSCTLLVFFFFFCINLSNTCYELGNAFTGDGRDKQYSSRPSISASRSKSRRIEVQRALMCASWLGSMTIADGSGSLSMLENITT
jgi:hypothetical protein